eukprot:71725_1
MSQFIEIIASLISIIMTLITSFITIMLVMHFKNDQKFYFKITSVAASMCNIFCAAFVSVYSIWIIFQHNQQRLFFIIVRALPTVFWFTGKIALIWLYNGRLYYTFKGGVYESSHCVFILINVSFTLTVSTLIVLGYYGIYLDILVFSMGFEVTRAIYFVLTLYLVLMFCKKMSLFQRKSYDAIGQIEAETDLDISDDSTHSNPNNEGDTSSTPQLNKCINVQSEQELQFFMKTTTKYAVLVLCSSISACLVQFCWSLYDFLVPQNYLGLLLPLTMFSVDSLINTICIYLLFQFGHAVYARRCRKCDTCCRNICVYLYGHFWLK